jgi:hypothetical protein
MKIKPIRSAWYEIADGDKGIYETVDYMWNYALRDTKEPLIKNLVSSLRGKNDISTIKNIYDWVWKNVEYELDPPDREMIITPIHFVNGNRKAGDCDCMTRSLSVFWKQRALIVLLQLLLGEPKNIHTFLLRFGIITVGIF